MLYTKLSNIVYNIINKLLHNNCNVVVINKFKAQARNDLKFLNIPHNRISASSENIGKRLNFKSHIYILLYSYDIL